MTNELELMNN